VVTLQKTISTRTWFLIIEWWQHLVAIISAAIRPVAVTAGAKPVATVVKPVAIISAISLRRQPAANQ